LADRKTGIQLVVIREVENTGREIMLIQVKTISLVEGDQTENAFKLGFFAKGW
jgi:hypothetical protein